MKIGKHRKMQSRKTQKLKKTIYQKKLNPKKRAIKEFLLIGVIHYKIIVN